MKIDIETYIQHCYSCQIVQPIQPHPLLQLTPIPKQTSIADNLLRYMWVIPNWRKPPCVC